MEYDIHAVVFCYGCRLIEVEMHLNDTKINDLKWVDAESWKELEFMPSTREFIEMYIRAGRLTLRRTSF